MTKRILFLEHNTDGTVGGSHYCLLEICRGLDRRKFEPVVWFYQSNTLLDEFRAVAEVIVQPFPPPVHLAGRGAWRRALAPIQSFVNAYQTLVRRSSLWTNELRRLRIDLVHLNNSCSNDHDLLIAALRCGIPRVAHQRGFPPAPGRIHRVLARYFDRIISISRAVTIDLKSKGFATANVTLVHDGIEPDRIVAHSAPARARQQLGISETAPLVGVVGNVKPWKGQLTLIRAMRCVVNEFPDARCIVVGSISDAAYSSTLQQEIATAGLHDQVIFAGYQKHPALYTSAMDVVVHTSVDPEPFGIVILEAMALGKPVIATAHGGPLDIITHGQTGLLTKPADSDGLALELCGLLADPQRREAIGIAGRELLASRFTARHNVTHIERIYEEIFSIAS